jgi:hypothetical protein
MNLREEWIQGMHLWLSSKLHPAKRPDFKFILNNNSTEMKA